MAVVTSQSFQKQIYQIQLLATDRPASPFFWGGGGRGPRRPLGGGAGLRRGRAPLRRRGRRGPRDPDVADLGRVTRSTSSTSSASSTSSSS